MSDYLDLSKTYCTILEAAREKRFISYGDLAKANGARWQKVRRTIPRHLFKLDEIAASRDWPMPTAIVVNHKNIETGILDGTARNGFIGAAKELGFDFRDPAAFVEEQQQAVFAWAETAPDELIFSEEGDPKTKKLSGRQFVRLMGPLLDALRYLGGAGKPAQVYEEVAKSQLVTKEDLKVTNKSGRSKFKNQVRWARFYLAKAALIDRKDNHIWQLTPEGRETHLDQGTAIELVRDIDARLKTSSAEDVDEIDAPSGNEIGDIFDEPSRRFWFVGAVWDKTNDQTKRFFNEGIWQNGHHDKFTEHVAQMQPGDRIAIKASFTKKYNLPFENQNKPVSCMRIKAIGTVTEAATDGRTVGVNWQPLAEPRDWYFYTYRVAVVEADRFNERARRLIQFAFGDHKQDYEFWLRQPYWAKQYRTRTPTLTEIEIKEEEADTALDLEEADITPYGIGDILEDGCFLSQDALESALACLKNKMNLILQGPPGTGKTWLAKRLGYVLIGTKDRAVIRKRMRSIQFHPSLSYEDFVRGWRPDGDGQLSLIDGVFLEAVEAAHAEPDLPFVVIVEEINRGNPAQIFGEMLTLLEKDKRSEEQAVELAYCQEQGERVYIPSNLFLIGTMNIADRSLALVDLALRRRFAFVTLQTALNESWHKWCVEQTGIDEVIVTEIQRLMVELNDEIAADSSLGVQFQIGHSYVTPMPGEKINDARAWFRGIVETEIGPLLEEYWFDNLDKAKKLKTRLMQNP